MVNQETLSATVLTTYKPDGLIELEELYKDFRG